MGREGLNGCQYKVNKIGSWIFEVDNQNIQFEKQPLEVFYQKAVLKNFAIFTGKHHMELEFELEFNFIK